MITAAQLLKIGTTVVLSSLFSVSSVWGQAQPAPTTNPAPPSVLPQTPLDFAPLETALASQRFEQANEITRRLLLAAANRTPQGWLTTDSINTIPCGDLQKIDALWRQYSDNRFGFSVQYDIFVQTGNRPGRLMAPESYDKFGDRLGWRQGGQWVIFKKNLDFSLSAPVGHLPNPRDEYQINGGRLEYTALMGRLQTCQGKSK